MGTKALLLPASALILVTPGPMQHRFPASTAVAQQDAAAAASATGRIAFADIQRAIEACDEGKAETAVWQQDVERRNLEYQRLQIDVDAIRNKLNVSGSKLIDEIRTDLVQELEDKEASLQFFQQNARKAVEYGRQRYQSVIFRKLRLLVEQLAKDRALSAVFFIGGDQDGYFDPAFVITDDLIAAYNKAYPVAKAPAVPQVKK
jgi:Skp family chaperone for outer membrane proteins